ncbi:hypothetical protein D3C81_1260980 [compost metagenome]
MQVGPGAASGIAQIADAFAFLHLVTDGDVDIAQMHVPALQAARMLDHDVFAVGAVPFGGNNLTCGRGINGVAYFSGDVDPRVEGSSTGEGIGAVTEIGGQPRG